VPPFGEANGRIRVDGCAGQGAYARWLSGASAWIRQKCSVPLRYLTQDARRTGRPGVGNAEAGDCACFCAKNSCQGATITDNGEDERSSELVSQRACESACHATSARARACSVVRAGTRQIRPSVFFESTPTTGV
jgi:hypothetical protein